MNGTTRSAYSWEQMAVPTSLYSGSAFNPFYAFPSTPMSSTSKASLSTDLPANGLCSTPEYSDGGEKQGGLENVTSSEAQWKRGQLLQHNLSMESSTKVTSTTIAHQDPTPSSDHSLATPAINTLSLTQLAIGNNSHTNTSNDVGKPADSHRSFKLFNPFANPTPYQPHRFAQFALSNALSSEEDGVCASGDRRQRKRILFSSAQVRQLEEAYFARHFINCAERADLANRVGLTPSQVKIWYQNRRYKEKKMEKDRTFTQRNLQRQLVGSPCKPVKSEMGDEDDGSGSSCTSSTSRDSKKKKKKKKTKNEVVVDEQKQSGQYPSTPLTCFNSFDGYFPQGYGRQVDLATAASVTAGPTLNFYPQLLANGPGSTNLYPHPYHYGPGANQPSSTSSYPYPNPHFPSFYYG